MVVGRAICVNQKQIANAPLHVAPPMQSLSASCFEYFSLALSRNSKPTHFLKFNPHREASLSELKLWSSENWIETMAFAHYMLAVPVESSNHPKISVLNSSFSHSHSLCFASSSHRSKSPNLSILPTFRKIGHKGNFIISFLLPVVYSPQFFAHFLRATKLLGFW